MLVHSSSSSSSSSSFTLHPFSSNHNNMEFPDIPTGRSPRRELQGPRPTPLRIHKDSHKIKKPPLAPQPSQPQPPPRQPIIIYTVSPKIIHTTPSDFMNLVQRLTGSSSTSSEPPSNTNDPFNSGDGMVSPAARYATIEKAMSPMGKKQLLPSGDIISDVEGIEIMGHGVERQQSMFQGILSPGPASLSPIPSNFFSPPSSDPSMVSFLHDLSPVLHSTRNFMEGGFVMPSPSNFNFLSPHTPSIDLFNYFLD
ncbi:protein MKS1-like [Abrus precatorius]|uniref:Protein MKS1-like n=1 Tax=Abrus precatorius TaxID=3816 RepID=A0A8B8K6S4_ABRPR|nr:protein MKS1-like [Abrus precatorius]